MTAEPSARELARAWTSGLEAALGGVRTELSELSYALSAQASSADAADDEVVALARTLCASAAELGARYDSLTAFVTAAPSLSLLLSVAEAKLDAADAALDATEAALGIPPVVVKDAPSPPPPADGLLEGMRAMSIASRVRTAVPAALASSPVARPPARALVASPVRTRKYATQTRPAVAKVKEPSLPNTPTLADFGISDDTLSGIYAPPVAFPMRDSPPRVPSPQAPVTRSAWAAKVDQAIPVFEETSPAQEEDPGDETYDETIGRYMERLGIEPADVLRSRYGRPVKTSPSLASPPQLRGLDGQPLYSEETPRVQTRKLRSQSAFAENLGGYEGAKK